MPNTTNKKPASDRRITVPELIEYAKIIREMIYHEGELVNHRFQWFALLNGLLFGAFGLLWQFFGTSKPVVVVIPILGIASSTACLVSMLLGDRACNRLELLFDERLERCDDCTACDIPPVTGIRDRTWFSHFLPWRWPFFACFIAAWIWTGCVAWTTPPKNPKESEPSSAPPSTPQRPQQ